MFLLALNPVYLILWLVSVNSRTVNGGGDSGLSPVCICTAHHLSPQLERSLPGNCDYPATPFMEKGHWHMWNLPECNRSCSKSSCGYSWKLLIPISHISAALTSSNTDTCTCQTVPLLNGQNQTVQMKLNAVTGFITGLVQSCNTGSRYLNIYLILSFRNRHWRNTCNMVFRFTQNY